MKNTKIGLASLLLCAFMGAFAGCQGEDKEQGELLLTDFLQVDAVVHGSDVFVKRLADGLSAPPIIGRTPHPDHAACRYHDLTRDEAGNIYLADLTHKRVEKWVRK